MLDTIVEDLDEATSRTTDPESSGVCDLSEEVLGLGFVACQRFLVAATRCHGREKQTALKMGPHVKGNLTIAQIVNGAANYWKHHDEWWNEAPSPSKKCPLKLFEDSIDFHNLLSSISAWLLGSHYRLSHLLPLLDDWQNEISSEPDATRMTVAKSAGGEIYV